MDSCMKGQFWPILKWDLSNNNRNVIKYCLEELNTSQDPFQYSSVWGHCVMKGAVFPMRIKGKVMF